MGKIKNNLTILFAIFFSISIIAQTDINYTNGEKIPCEEIIIKCYQGRESKLVIRNEVEYQALLNERSPHPECPIYQLPIIDFTKYTLLGIRTGVSGCKEPSSEHVIYYNQQQNSYLFELLVIQNGLCERLNHIKIWCLIPKIDENISVEFKQEIKVEDETR